MKKENPDFRLQQQKCNLQNKKGNCSVLLTLVKSYICYINCKALCLFLVSIISSTVCARVCVIAVENYLLIVKHVYYLFIYVSEIETKYTMMIWTYQYICLYPGMPLPLYTATQAYCSPISSLRIYDKHPKAKGRITLWCIFLWSVCIFKGNSREKVTTNRRM